MLESSIRYIIDRNLENKNWVLDPNSINKNVMLGRDLPSEFKRKIRGQKEPDYTLFNNENIPIGIIEAKRGGENLEKALKQATEYAKDLETPLIFASNGTYCESRHLKTEKRLKLNDVEVKELLSYKEALTFLENKSSNEAYTIPKDVIKDRGELISIFKKINDNLRSGLRDMDRFNEFANILFIKLISEGKEGEGDLWKRLKDEKESSLINYINNTLLLELKSRYGGDVLTSLKTKNPKIIKTIIHHLDPLLLSPIDWDIKGGAFEYFIAKATSTGNDLGEYYTPRHIIKSIISLVKPKFDSNKKETIYDPFCGTGGFLTCAFNYIKENNNIKDKDLEILSTNCIYGNEIMDTSRIAKMNMILHGDGHSGVEQMDSLANPVEHKYDIVVTNIPFSQKTTHIDEKGKIKNEITDKYNEGLARNDGNSLCVLHCFKAVKKGGRMAVVVPEGFLENLSLKQVRSYLLGNSNLQSVISLPRGVFSPYASGVKTNILYFTDCHYKSDQKDFWCFNIENDGYSLDTKRRELEGDNDLNRLNASEITYKEDETKTLKETGFFLISMDEVKERNYNLVGKFYKKVEITSDYSLVRLGNFCNCYQPKTITRKEIKEEGMYKVFGANGIIGFYDKFNHDKEEVAVTCRGATCGSINFTEPNSWITGNAMVCQPKDKNILYKRFLYYILQQSFIMKGIIKGTAHPQIIKEDIENVKIPLPVLKEQKKIIGELDNYKDIVESTKNAISGWKPFFKIGKDWKIKKIQEVCEVEPRKPALNKKIEVSFIPMKDIPIRGYKFLHSKIKPLKEVERGYTYFRENDVLLAKITPCFENGKCGIATNLKNKIGFGSTEFIVLRCKNSILTEYLYLFLEGNSIQEKGKDFMKGTVGQQRISIDFIKDYQIPVPPLKKQKEIIEKIEKERNLIDSLKEVVKLFENKIKEKINSFYET